VSAAAAWEYCIYVYDHKDYGYFDQEGKRIERPHLMSVKYTGTGTDEKLKIELPLKYLGEEVDRVRFTVATTKPGFLNPSSSKNMFSRATDVYPGGRKVLINSGVIGGYGLCFIDEGGLHEGGGGGSATDTYEYRYDEFGRQIFEREAHYSWEVYRYYAYGYGLLSRKQGESGTPEYLHTDILGSVTAVTGNSGDTLGTYAYDPFGDLLTSATNLGNWRFTGQEWDNQTDLYHFPARYYEPEWGRFLTTDPWTGMPDDKRNLVMQQNHALNKMDPQILNLYQYVANNPVNYVDPSGLFFKKRECESFSQCYDRCVNTPEMTTTSDVLRHFSAFGDLEWILSLEFAFEGGQWYLKWFEAKWLEKIAQRGAAGQGHPLTKFLEGLGIGVPVLKAFSDGSLAVTLGLTFGYLISRPDNNLYCMVLCHFWTEFGGASGHAH